MPFQEAIAAISARNARKAPARTLSRRVHQPRRVFARSARFLHNPKVTVEEMVGRARARACAQVAGRHVLAIQDTSALRVNEKGLGLSFHPVIAVDANGGTVLGLVDAFF